MDISLCFTAKLGIFNSSFSSTDSLNFAVHFGLSVAPQVSLLFIISGKFVSWVYNDVCAFVCVGV